MEAGGGAGAPADLSELGPATGGKAGRRASTSNSSTWGLASLPKGSSREVGGGCPEGGVPAGRVDPGRGGRARGGGRVRSGGSDGDSSAFSGSLLVAEEVVVWLRVNLIPFSRLA